MTSLDSPSYYANVKLYGDYDYYQEYGDSYYIVSTFNTVANAWYATGNDNAGVDLDIKSVELFTNANECSSCESATSIISLLRAFESWSLTEKIFGTYSGGSYNNDTDLAFLYDTRQFDSSIGKASYRGAGIKYQSNYKVGVGIIYPGMYIEVREWLLSHEFGHLFYTHHEANSAGGNSGPSGHRAHTWCDWEFWGNCLTWRDTNMFYKYIFSRFTIGQFSRDGVHGGTTDTNNAYWIQFTRNNYLRQI